MQSYIVTYSRLTKREPLIALGYPWIRWTRGSLVSVTAVGGMIGVVGNASLRLGDSSVMSDS